MTNCSSETLLERLQKQLSFEAFGDILRILHGSDYHDESLRIGHPSSSSAKVIDQLLTVNIPDFWNILYHAEYQPPELETLVACLRNVVALGSINSHLRFLVSTAVNKQDIRDEGSGQNIVILLELLAILLAEDALANSVWNSFQKSEGNILKRQMMWMEFLKLVPSGKLLGTMSQAANLVKPSAGLASWDYITTGSNFAHWLGLNIVYMTRFTDADDDEKWKAITFFFGRSILLGYSNETIKPIIESAFSHTTDIPPDLVILVKRLRESEQKNFLKPYLRFVAGKAIDSDGGRHKSGWQTTSKILSALTYLTAKLLEDNKLLRSIIVTHLTSAFGYVSENDIFTFRVLTSSLCKEMESLKEVFEKNLTTFSDKLYIKHAPIMHQQAMAQILLLATSYVHRADPMFVFTYARSSILTQGISNRLSALSSEARFLGMVVSTAFSKLVDKPDHRISFEFDSSEKKKADWYINLIYIDDPIGTVEDLIALKGSATNFLPINCSKRSKQLQSKSSPRISLTKVTRPRGIIQEIKETQNNNEEDLVPYAKADSDPEDEEDDPTLVKRDRPKPPVYIRDLIVGLNDSENYDRHMLALESAAELIQKKANFGREVTDHIYQLSSILVGLQNHYERDGFDELRLQAMIAVLLASPEAMGPWFSREYFNGDYSLSQRVAILSAIGLGTRQLAGLTTDSNNGESTEPKQNKRPFRSLPGKLHNLYISSSSPIEAVAKDLEHVIVQPVALKAADKLSGPDALKVRTFSSRIDVEKRRKKPIANQLAKIVDESFFFPLIGLWTARVQNSGTTNIFLSPTLLPHFIKTIALLLHASGPSTLSLAQMTSEFWTLLLSLRTRVLNSTPSLEAVLFALLVILEINLEGGGKQRLVQEHARDLQETQEWTELVFGTFDERSSGEEGSRVKTLAASVLMKLKELVEWYQGILFR